MEVQVVDVETTGVNEGDAVVEIAAATAIVHATRAEYVMAQESLVDPGMDIPPTASAIHHLTSDDVVGSPSLQDAVVRIIECQTLVAHNSRFDSRFLSPFLPSGVVWIDTYRCALRAWPDAPKHTNQVLRYWLGLKDVVPPMFVSNQPLVAHRAMFDVLTTLRLFDSLLRVMSVSEMLEISSRPALLPTVHFGKHAGEKWSEVPKSYLRWIVEKGAEFDEDVAFTAAQYLVA